MSRRGAQPTFSSNMLGSSTSLMFGGIEKDSRREGLDEKDSERERLLRLLAVKYTLIELKRL